MGSITDGIWHETERENRGKWLYRCQGTEDMYHIFVRCERFRGLRLEVPDSICKKVERQIVEYKIKESLVEGLLKAAKLFFKDLTDIWPLHYSTLYLGHDPQLEKLVPVVAATRPLSRACFLYNVHSDLSFDRNSSHLSYLGNGSERHGKEKGRLWDEDLIEVKERLISISPNVGPSRHSVLSSCGKRGYRNVNNVNKPLC